MVEGVAGLLWLLLGQNYLGNCGHGRCDIASCVRLARLWCPVI